MSDIEGVQDQESGTDAGETGGQGSEVTDYSQSQYSPFLNTVDEAHREVVEPYLKKWDGLTTRRFQELQQQYQPYRELGDFELVERAKQIYDTLENDPQRFYEVLSEQLGYEIAQEEMEAQEESPVGGLPSEFLTEYEQMKELVQQLGQQVLGSQQQQIDSQEDAAVQDWIDNRKEAYGDFDEDYVITKMFNGMDGDEAIAQYFNLTQSHVNQAMSSGANLPPILNGSGSIPADDVRITDASSKEVKNLVAELLARSQSSG